MITLYVLGGIFSYLGVGGYVSGRFYRKYDWKLEESPAIMGITIFWPVLWTFLLGNRSKDLLPEARVIK